MKEGGKRVVHTVARIVFSPPYYAWPKMRASLETFDWKQALWIQNSVQFENKEQSGQFYCNCLTNLPRILDQHPEKWDAKTIQPLAQEFLAHVDIKKYGESVLLGSFILSLMINGPCS